MIRIIDRDIYEGKYSEDEFKVVFHDLGNGHHEASIAKTVVWDHLCTMSPTYYEMYLEQRAKEDTPEARAEKEAANAERAARRAKTKVRRMCKVMGVDSLLTLTYRANQTDLKLCKSHMKEFVRRVRRVIPGFLYVAAFEQQERGAWHVHMAIHKLPFKLAWEGVKVNSYSVVRAIWRRVVGDLGGNIDEARKKRHSRKSPAQMASYISKYMLKAYEEGDKWSNRYSASSCELPEAIRMRIKGESLANLIAMVYERIGQSGKRTNFWLSDFKDRFFLSSEDDPGGYPAPH